MVVLPRSQDTSFMGLRLPTVQTLPFVYPAEQTRVRRRTCAEGYCFIGLVKPTETFPSKTFEEDQVDLFSDVASRSAPDTFASKRLKTKWIFFFSRFIESESSCPTASPHDRERGSYFLEQGGRFFFKMCARACCICYHGAT